MYILHAVYWNVKGCCLLPIGSKHCVQRVMIPHVTLPLYVCLLTHSVLLCSGSSNLSESSSPPLPSSTLEAAGDAFHEAKILQLDGAELEAIVSVLDYLITNFANVYG